MSSPKETTSAAPAGHKDPCAQVHSGGSCRQTHHTAPWFLAPLPVRCSHPASVPDVSLQGMVIPPLQTSHQEPKALHKQTDKERPEGEGPCASSLGLHHALGFAGWLVNPAKPACGTGGTQELMHVSSTTPFQASEPRAQGFPKAAAVSYETAQTRTAEHQEEGGTR